MDDLANLYFATNPSNREYMIGVFAELAKLSTAPETTRVLITGLLRSNKLRELSLMAYDAAEGKKSFDDVVALSKQLSDQSTTAEAEDEFTFVSSDLEELVNGSIRKAGLRWRLSTLNHMLGSLRIGDFGFLFARPETGKTTFLASEVTHMASQASSPILWFNNEEQGEKVMLRCIQASLGLTLEQLYSDLSGNKKKFLEITQGNIKIYDASQISQKTVEKACEKYQPSLIVFDQIDKIQSPANDREDLRLGAIYQWARELAKTFAPVIGVSQADGGGEGVRWLTMAHVANAKTAKQAEADWMLGIGKINEAGFDNIRFLHASKNKLLGDEDTDHNLRHGRKEVIIDAEIARYRDID